MCGYVYAYAYTHTTMLTYICMNTYTKTCTDVQIFGQTHCTIGSIHTYIINDYHMLRKQRQTHCTIGPIYIMIVIYDDLFIHTS